MSTKENGAATTGAAYDPGPMMRLCGAAIPALSGFNGAVYQKETANVSRFAYRNRWLRVRAESGDPWDWNWRKS
jgi:hypothetical protein